MNIFQAPRPELSAAERQLFIERAKVYQFECGFLPLDAERLALKDVADAGKVPDVTHC